MRQPVSLPDLTWIRRGAWAIAGLLWFLWIAYEDRGTASVLLISAAISAALALTALSRWALGRTLERRGWMLRTALVGLMGGGLVGPFAALLMMLKASLHVHPTPDFTAAQLLTVLQGAPVWAVAGLTIGAGGSILCLYRSAERNQSR